MDSIFHPTQKLQSAILTPGNPAAVKVMAWIDNILGNK